MSQDSSGVVRLPKQALGATLAAALALTTATAAPSPASAGDVKINADAIAAASFFALVAAAVIATSRKNSGPGPELERPDPRKVLPADCRFDLRHGPGRGRFYGRRCLITRFDYWPYLPERCETAVELSPRRPDIIAYDASCLARFGYRTGGEPYRVRR